MTAYIATLAWAYVCFLLSLRQPLRKQFLFALAGLLPLTLLAVFRYSGTDTEIYEYILWIAHTTGRPTGFEPAFDWLARGLVALTGSEVLAVRLMALAYGLLLAIFVYRSDRTERYMLFLFFIPAFFFQYGMNAVRAGLGLALILLSWQSLRRNNPVSAGILGLLAPFFHVSVLAVLGPLVLSEIFLALPPRKRIQVAGFFLLLATAILLLEWERIAAKAWTYFFQEQGEREWLRGGSRTLMVALVGLGLALSPLRPLSKALGLAVLFGVTAPAQVLATSSLAGPRLLELASLLAPLVALRLHDLEGRQVGRVFLALLLAAGLVGGGFFFRQQLKDWGGRHTGTATPFFPYRTVWEHNPCPPSSYYPLASPRDCPFHGAQENIGLHLSPYSPYVPPKHPPLPY